MNIKEAKEQIKNAITAYLIKDEFGDYKISIEHQRPVFLLGAPGIGKTAIMEQIAQETGLNLISYSMAHQTRESAMGLPNIVTRNYIGKDEQVSEYTMSEIIANIYNTMEDTGIREGILFLDEINCVSTSLAPIMLQFLQYKIFGLHQIPPGWVIVTAGNPPEYNRSVVEFDMATWDRFKRVDCEAVLSIWMEYAYYAGVHPCIMTYLKLYPDHYYLVHPDVKEIVTSRAWEDLSEMMQLYEELGIPVDDTLIAQYLQKDEVHEGFSAYYDIFNTYREKYDIDAILEGNITQQDVDNYAAADPSEKLAVMLLLIDSVTYTMRSCIQMEKMIRQIHPMLEDTIIKINSGLSSRQILTEHIMNTDKNLERAIRARNISPSNKKIQHWILHNLYAYIDKCTNEGNDNKKKCTQILQSAFNKLLAAAKSVTQQSMDGLENIFKFYEYACGADSPEVKSLITELKTNCHTTDFIVKYGSDHFYQLAGEPVQQPTYNNLYELNLEDCLAEDEFLGSM